MKRFIALCLAFVLPVGALSAQSSDVNEIRQWAASAVATSQYGSDNWSAAQATGAPNVGVCGDEVKAWASETSTGQDSITLTYSDAVVPTEINIYQTYNPGAIVGVQVSNTLTGFTLDIPNSADPVGNTPCPGVFTLDVAELVPQSIDSVTIILDQSLTGSWNEIDAVELVGVLDTANPLSDVHFLGTTFALATPADWVDEVTTTAFYVASSPEALTAIKETQAVPAGEIGLDISSAAALSGATGLPADADPLEFLSTLSGLIGSTGTVESYPFPFEAAITFLQGSDIAPDGTALIAFATPEGTVAVAVSTGGPFSEFEALVRLILDTLLYNAD